VRPEAIASSLTVTVPFSRLVSGVTTPALLGFAAGARFALAAETGADPTYVFVNELGGATTSVVTEGGGVLSAAVSASESDSTNLSTEGQALPPSEKRSWTCLFPTNRTAFTQPNGDCSGTLTVIRDGATDLATTLTFVLGAIFALGLQVLYDVLRRLLDK